MKQNDEKKNARVLSQEEVENVTGGFRNVMAGLKKKPYPPKEK